MNRDFLKSQFNDPTYSDFKLIDDDNNVLYLHTFVMRQNKYFDTWFKSQLTPDKTKMHVTSVPLATKLIGHLYCLPFQIEDDIDYNDFFEMVELTQMWCLSEGITTVEFIFVIKNYEKMIRADINNCMLLYNYFESQCPINYHDKQYSGKWLKSKLVEYVTKNISNLNSGFINLPIAKLLSHEQYIQTCLSYKYYDKLTEHSDIKNNIYVNMLNKCIHDKINTIDTTIFTSKVFNYLDIENQVVLALKNKMYNLININSGFIDQHLVKRINYFVNGTIDNYDQQILNSNITQLLEPVLQASLYIKFNEYNKLLSIPLKQIKEAFTKYYDADIFTNNQLYAIMSADSMITDKTFDNLDNHKSSYKILHITSFVPFTGKLYTLIGTYNKISNDTFEIKPIKKIHKTDELWIENNTTKINKIKTIGNHELECIKKTNLEIKYIIELSNDIFMPKNSNVYKIQSLEL